MSDSFRRYTDLAGSIQLAKANGMATIQIVRVLSGNLSYAEVLKLARRAAPLLEISVAEFMSLRKNEA